MTAEPSWAEHKDRRHTYPPKVVDGIEATLAAIGHSDPAKRENWQQAYTEMCMAKHANPLLSMLHGMRILPSGAQYVCGPDSSDLGTMLSAQALWHSVGFGNAGIYVAVGHCSNNDIQTKLRAEACIISEQLLGLEPWFLEVTKPESPLKSRKVASALSTEAQRLQSEAERLRRETKLIQLNKRKSKKGVI